MSWMAGEDDVVAHVAEAAVVRERGVEARRVVVAEKDVQPALLAAGGREAVEPPADLRRDGALQIGAHGVARVDGFQHGHDRIILSTIVFS